MNERSVKSRSWLRWTAIIAGSIIALLAATAVVVPLFIPWEKLKPKAETLLTDTLHHKVTIGALGLNLLRGIEVRQLRIENAPGFSPDPLLTDETASVQYRLLPLLWGQVMVKAVVLERPEVRIERNADGLFNFTDMVSARTAAEPAPAEKPGGRSLPLSVLVSEVRVIGGALTFLDGRAKRTYAVRDFDLELRNFTLTGLAPAKLRVSARLEAGGWTLPVQVETELRLRLARQALVLDRLQAGVPGLTVQCRGQVADLFAGRTADLNGSVSIEAATLLTTLRPLLGGKLPADLGLDGQAAVTFTVKGPISDPAAITASVQDTLQLKAAAAGLNIPVSAEGRLDLAQAKLTVAQKVTVPSGGADLNATLTDLAGARILAGTLAADLDLTEAMSKLVPPAAAQKAAALKLSGRVQATAAASGPVSDPKQMDLTARVKADAVSVHYQGKAVVEKLSATLSVLPTKLSLPDLSMDLAGQPVRATVLAQGFDLRKPASLKPENSTLSLDWTLSSPLLDVDAFLALVPKHAEAAPVPATVTVSDLPEPDARTMMPAGFSMRGTAALGGLKYGRVKLGKIDLSTTVAKRVLDLTAALKGYDGGLGAKARLNFTQSLLGYTVDANTKSVDLEPLLNDVVDTFVAAKLKKPELVNELKDKLSGRLSGDLHLTGAGMRTVNAKPRLAGSGAFMIKDGKLRKFAFQENLARWFGRDQLRQDIPFDHTVMEFTLADQRVNIKKFQAQSGPQGDSGDLRLAAEGRLTFRAECQDLKLRPSLNPRAQGTLSPEFGRYAEVLKDERGWVTIPMTLNGPLNKPDVQPDWEWIKGRFGGYVETKAKSAAADAGKKLNDYIKTQQGKSAGEVKDNAVQELEKAKEKLKDLNLNNLFK